MNDKPSYLWSLAIGLGFVLLQLFVLLGGLNTVGDGIDYLFFFVAGVLIGLVLIYLLHRGEAQGKAARATWIGFYVSIPFAMFGMALGALTGPIGIIFFSFSPAVFIIACGYFIGRMVRGRS